MRKKTLAALSTVCAVALSCFGASVLIDASAAEPTETTTVTYGDYDANTYWDLNTWCGASKAGVVRTGLRTQELLIQPGYGNRFSYKARTENGNALDLSHLKFTVDLSESATNYVHMLTFGTYGNYVANNGNKFNIEFFRSGTVADTVHFVIGTGSPHNISYDVIVDETGSNPVTNDNTYMGINVPSLVVNFEANLTGDNYVFTLNGAQYSIPAATILESAVTWTGHSMVYGAMASGGGKYSLHLSNFEDKNMQVYYSDTGAHGLFLADMESLEEILDEGISSANMAEAKTCYDAMTAEYANLSYGDDAWYAQRYNAAVTEYETQFAELGVDDIISSLEPDITAYTAVSALGTEAEALAALALQTKAKAAVTLLQSIELNEEQQTRVDGYAAAIAETDAKVIAAAKSIVEGQVAAYATAVEAVTDLATYKAALAARSAVNGTLKALLSESEIAEIDSAVEAQGTALAGKNESDELEGVTSSGVVFVAGEGFEFYGGRVISNDKILVTNMELTFTLVDIPSSPSAWFSFGVMEKPAQFIVADNSSVTENKGLFTMFEYDATTKMMKVSVFHQTMSSGKFYDGQLSEAITFSYTPGEEIKVRLNTYTETLAGVTSEYLRVSINGYTLQDVRITTNSLKTSLGIDADGNLLPAEESLRGYLVLASNGGTYSGSVSTINKTDAKAEIPEDAGTEAYDEVSALIAQLPKSSEVTTENLAEVKALVAQIKEAYNALSSEEKALVSGYSSVATIEAVIANLEREPVNPGDSGDSGDSAQPGTSDSVSGGDGSSSSGGCGSVVGGLSVVSAAIALLGGAFVLSKKRKND